MPEKILILKAVVIIDCLYLEALKKGWGESLQAKLLQEFKEGKIEIIDYQFREAKLITKG